MTEQIRIEGLRYVTDEAGERREVIVPIDAWESLIHELEVLREKDHILSGLQKACREAKMQAGGELPEQCLGEFLDEL